MEFFFLLEFFLMVLLTAENNIGKNKNTHNSEISNFNSFVYIFLDPLCRIILWFSVLEVSKFSPKKAFKN